MNRNRMIDFLKYSPDIFDIIIIGGGATGLGAAVDAASRGYRALVLESHDFAKATSSRSTKLIHGGLRYLKQGNIGLVKEALHERGVLCKNAPHLVRSIPFLIPTYSWSENKYYQLGLKIYDKLAGDLKLEKSKSISKEEIVEKYPTIDAEKIYGGVVYYDGQFDDARLAITLAKTCVSLNGIVINYCQVTGFLKKNNKIIGVIAHDTINKKEYRLHAKVVVNATGVFSDEIRCLDDEGSPKMIQPSQGVHLVLNKSVLKCNNAIIIPKIRGNRVLFLIPWHNHALIGTTDTKVKQINHEPKALDDEIDSLLFYASKYLKTKVSKSDILSVFAGLRPLIRKEGQATSKLSRKHLITISESNLVTINGGKWTTYRKMAQDVIDKAIQLTSIKFYPSETENLKLHGYSDEKISMNAWDIYGSEKEKIEALIQANSELKNPIHPNLPYLTAEIIWACQDEMAETVEDVLARRTRALFLDSNAAVESAELVADLMAKEKAKDHDWKKNQIQSFKELAKKYFTVS